MSKARRPRASRPVIDVEVPAAGASVDPFALKGRDPASSLASSMMDPSMQLWRPSSRSPDSDVLPGLALSRARARDLDRNSGIAKAGIQSVADNVVGTGLRLSPRPDYLALGQTKEWAVAWARVVVSKWCAYFWSTKAHAGDTLTGDQITQQVLRMWMLNGESVELPLWIPDRDEYATKLQVVESDRLSNPNGQPETVAFHGGIEFDPYGMPLAYHIRNAHPGSTLMDTSGDMYTWTRVPRRFPDGRLRVLHQFTQDRPSQSRGVPLFAPVLSQFKQLDRYKAAEVMAAIVNACLSMSIETPMEADDIIEMFQKDPKAYGEWRLKFASEAAMSPGTIVPLMPGDKMSANFPARPATQYASFVRAVMQEIAAGLDMPVELLMKDFTDSTYSSARAAMIEAWKAFNRRRDLLATQLLDPWFELWLEEMVDKGEIDAPMWSENRSAYLRARWIGPGKGYVDPVKEAQGATLRMDAGLSTLEDECAEQGKDWQEVLEQRAYEQAELTRLGLKLGQMNVQTPPGQTGEPNGGEETPPKKDQPKTPKSPAQQGTGG
jgi:lambda family phage portal protein